MKKILILIIFASFALGSCNNNSKKTDSNEDVHKNDAHDHSSHSEKPEQISFDVETGDTIKSNTKCSEHSHDDKDEHKH